MVYNNPIFGPTPNKVNELLAFVLMPFKDDTKLQLQQIYESIVEPIVKKKGLDCKRADDYMTTTAIIQDIWRGICESRLVIADTTGLNDNVMYELGIAHALGKTTIIIHQRGDTQIPFDFTHIRRIEYENNMIGLSKLERNLELTLSTVLKEPLTDMISEGKPKTIYLPTPPRVTLSSTVPTLLPVKPVNGVVTIFNPFGNTIVLVGGLTGENDQPYFLSPGSAGRGIKFMPGERRDIQVTEASRLSAIAQRNGDVIEIESVRSLDD